MFLAEATGRKDDLPVLFGFLFLYNYPLLMGFYNFSLAIPLFFSP